MPSLLFRCVFFPSIPLPNSGLMNFYSFDDLFHPLLSEYRSLTNPPFAIGSLWPPFLVPPVSYLYTPTDKCTGQVCLGFVKIFSPFPSSKLPNHPQPISPNFPGRRLSPVSPDIIRSFHILSHTPFWRGYSSTMGCPRLPSPVNFFESSCL